MKKVVLILIGSLFFFSLFYIRGQQLLVFAVDCTLTLDNPQCEGTAGWNLSIAIPDFNPTDPKKEYYVRFSGNDPSMGIAQSDLSALGQCVQLDNGTLKASFKYGANVGTHGLIIKEKGRQFGCSERNAGSLIPNDLRIKFNPPKGISASIINPSRGLGEKAIIQVQVPYSGITYHVKLNRGNYTRETASRFILNFTDQDGSYNPNGNNTIGLWYVTRTDPIVMASSTPQSYDIFLGHFDFAGNVVGGSGSTGSPPTFPSPSPPCAKDKLIDGKCTEVSTAVGTIQTDPAGLVSFLFKLILGLSGGIALILIIVGAYQMMTSQGNPEKLQGAKETITSAIVGLLFIIFSFLLLEIIGVDILQIPGLVR